MFLVEARTRRPALDGGRDLSIDKNAVAIESHSENRRNTFDARDTDAVISCEVSQAVGD